MREISTNIITIIIHYQFMPSTKKETMLKNKCVFFRLFPSLGYRRNDRLEYI